MNEGFKPFFKSHALTRIKQRSSVGVDYFYWLIYTGRFSKVAREGKNRIHMAVWIKDENRHMVLVADERDGHVITMIPCNYHEISSELLDEARQLAEEEVDQPAKIDPPVLEVANKKCIKVKAFFHNDCGVRTFKKLISWPVMDARELDTIELNGSFMEAVKQKVEDEGWPVEELIAQYGKKGDIRVIPYDPALSRDKAAGPLASGRG